MKLEFEEQIHQMQNKFQRETEAERDLLGKEGKGNNDKDGDGEENQSDSSGKYLQ